jgi:diguanylate cyclase
MLEARSQADDAIRAEKLLRSIKRAQLTIALAYTYDSLILLGFWAAGFIDVQVPLIVGVLLALLVGIVNWAHRSGWSLKRTDPTLFLPQQLYAICVALGVAIAAPQIGFQPFATLIAICTFSFMAPSQRTLLWSWGAAAIGAAAVIFATGPRLEIPTSTLAGQALTSAVMLGVLARCIWVAAFFYKLQRRLSEKNKALKAAIEQIDAMANRDELTGLPNRRSIMRWLAEQMAPRERDGLALSIAILDIDHFKTINDAHGHLVGDRTLQLFSECVSRSVRATDRLGRYGGEEFLLVLVGTKLAEAEAPLQRIREQVGNWDWSAIDRELHLTITAGATEYAKGDSVEDLIRRADLALYLGKESGRDRVVLDRTPFDQYLPS